MELYKFEARTKEEALKQAYENLNKSDYELITKTDEESLGLFKGKKVILTVVVIDEIVQFVKEHLLNITDLMEINIRIEVKKRSDSITFVMYSDNSSILIGKNGKNLNALQTIIRQIVFKETGMYFNIIIDAENYKENNKRKIEFLAKRVVKEVIETKIEVKLDPMNAYDRRIVHTVLSDFKNIETESYGEDPNRYIVIKYKEED